MAGSGISREDAVRLMEGRISGIALRRHCLATGAIMAALAAARGEDAGAWEAAGLLHDLDFEETADTPERHGIPAAETVADILPAPLVHAILAHNAENNGHERSTPEDHLLTAAECITGLISATALVQPDRRLSSVSAESVLKRMNKSGFARAVNRDGIMSCERAGMGLPEFVGLSLSAMSAIAEDLGL